MAPKKNKGKIAANGCGIRVQKKKQVDVAKIEAAKSQIGYAQNQYQLAYNYRHGIRCEQNLQKAQEIYWIAYDVAFKVDIEALKIDIKAERTELAGAKWEIIGKASYAIGLIYDRDGLYGKALPYFNRSANADYAKAYRAMGLYYENGKGGCGKNLKLALSYYKQYLQSAQKRDEDCITEVRKRVKVIKEELEAQQNVSSCALSIPPLSFKNGVKNLTEAQKNSAAYALLLLEGVDACARSETGLGTLLPCSYSFLRDSGQRDNPNDTRTQQTLTLSESSFLN